MMFQNVDYEVEENLAAIPGQVVPASTFSTSSFSTRPPFNRTPWVIGHRGCPYDELENTREGFARCGRMEGCDAAELDAFVLKCGTVVVFHGDGTDARPGGLRGYCGVDGSILDYTYAEAVANLSFDPSYAEFGCPAEIVKKGRIPTLEEILQDAKVSGLHLKIELKGPGVVEPVLDLVDRLDAVDQCSFSSFQLDWLAHLRKLRPEKDPQTGGFKYRTGAIFGDLHDVDGDGGKHKDVVAEATAVGASEVHLRYDTCTRDVVERVHRAGLGTMAWFRGIVGMARDADTKYWDVGNEDGDMYETVLRTGVEQMCVNRPDVLAALVDRIASSDDDQDYGWSSEADEGWADAAPAQ